MKLLSRAARSLLILAVLCTAAFGQSAVGTVLTNPLLPSGPDPWVTFHDGFYYYMNTTATNLTLWKARSMADLAKAEKRVIWTPPTDGPYSHDIWAPEVHYLEGKWYVYFAADAGKNKSHRMWVIENASPDPMKGEWTFKGEVTDPTDKWAIDPSVFENRGSLYLIWSGWAGDANGAQNIYIAKLKNPWTVEGKRVLLSSPQYEWEEHGDLDPMKSPDDPPHVNVNEGPEILKHSGKLFLIFSASGCWTDYYELGMLTASDSSNLLDPKSWIKSSKPVFVGSPESGVFAPGHNSFFQTEEGKENWILYHANAGPHEGCANQRSPRAQPFSWKPDGSPDFGTPAPTSTHFAWPTGQKQ